MNWFHRTSSGWFVEHAAARFWWSCWGLRRTDELCLNRLTVRCFYPLSGINRLSVDRTFRSEAPGFGFVDIFKSLKGYARQSKFAFIKMAELSKSLSSADPGNGLAAAPCVTGTTAKDPTHGVHLTAAAGLRPRPGYLGDPPRQVSSPNYPSRPQASVIGAHQVTSEASLHPGLHSIQNQDQRVASLSTGDYSHSVSPAYDQLVDISLLLSNLSRQSLSILVRGENLDQTDATPALNSGSKLPRHPVIGQLEMNSGQPEMATLVGPNRLVKNVWHSGLSNHPSVSPVHPMHQDMQGRKLDTGVKTMALSPCGSPEGGSRLNSEGTRGGLPEYDPPLLPSQARHSPGQPGKQNCPAAQTKPAALQSTMDPVKPVGPEQGSSARTQSEQNVERSGSPEKRTADASGSKVHNVRVKPPSRFVSSANPLRQKPLVWPLKWGPTVSSSQEHVADQGPSSTHLSPNQQTHLPNPVHSSPNHPVAGTGHGGSLGSALALRNPVQAAGKIGTALF